MTDTNSTGLNQENSRAFPIHLAVHGDYHASILYKHAARIWPQICSSFGLKQSGFAVSFLWQFVGRNRRGRYVSLTRCRWDCNEKIGKAHKVSTQSAEDMMQRLYKVGILSYTQYDKTQRAYAFTRSFIHWCNLLARSYLAREIITSPSVRFSEIAKVASMHLLVPTIVKGKKARKASKPAQIDLPARSTTLGNGQSDLAASSTTLAENQADTTEKGGGSSTTVDLRVVDLTAGGWWTYHHHSYQTQLPPNGGGEDSRAHDARAHDPGNLTTTTIRYVYDDEVKDDATPPDTAPQSGSADENRSGNLIHLAAIKRTRIQEHELYRTLQANREAAQQRKRIQEAAEVASLRPTDPVPPSPPSTAVASVDDANAPDALKVPRAQVMSRLITKKQRWDLSRDENEVPYRLACRLVQQYDHRDLLAWLDSWLDSYGMDNCEEVRINSDDKPDWHRMAEIIEERAKRGIAKIWNDKLRP